MASKRRAKQILINPAFQLKFVGLMVTLLVGLSLAYWFAVQKSFREFREMGRSAALPPDHVFYAFIDRQQHSLNLMMLLTFGIVILVGVAFGLWFSHRIAGPLYRLRISLDQMAEARALGHIKFRDADFFQEIPESFNRMKDRTQAGSTN